MIPSHVVGHGGEGPPVVLLNSLGTTVDMWEPQVGPLGERFSPVRFDARGHGRTPYPGGPVTVDDLAGDVADLLDHLGIASAHLVGASLGGAVAMRFAVREPERVRRLVLVSTAAKLGTAASWSERAATVRAEGCAAVSGPAMGRWFSAVFTAAEPAAVAAFRERFDACDAEGYAACCEALGGFDAREEVSRIAAPTLIVYGTADPVVGAADAAFLEARIPSARTVSAAGAKHLVTAERPDWCNRVLVGFLSGNGPSEGGPSGGGPKRSDGDDAEERGLAGPGTGVGDDE